MRLAQLSGATLVIANLGRLSRNSAFLLTLRDGGAKFVAADLPDVCDLTIGLLATVAQHEREMISKRIREALETKRAALAAEAAAKRARGEDAVRELEDGSSQPLRLGNPNGARCLAGPREQRGGRRQEGQSRLSGREPSGCTGRPRSSGFNVGS
ncbi:recombinase family protein [Chenggangzhangella methanolivorans]|uniref:recombinase family protein n=1 Tax=Chenggangzhangella methanolivorans TaxID=1437009 RepID=UPI0021BD4AD8|nr:recombinase family protein [Chenggangzhangella methanolivorans]